MAEKSSSHERKVQGYLKPKTHALFIGFVEINDVSESSAINMILKDYFNRLPERERLEFLNKAKK
jgi:hypothetical protein